MFPKPQSARYFARYLKLVEYASHLSYSGYTETHHILPASMGGTDLPDNLVVMSARMHFLAHWMLWKAYKNTEMSVAFWMMRHVKSPGQDRYQRLSSIVYANLKKEFSEKHPMKQPEVVAKISGDNSPSKTSKSREARSGPNHFSAKVDYVCKTAGEKHHMKRPEVVARLSGENHYSKKEGYVSKLIGDNNPMKRPEVAAKVSGDNNAAKRPEVRKKMSLNGSMRRPEVAAKISGDNHYSKKEGYINKKKGRADIIVTCPHCHKQGGKSNMKRWHFDHCKLKQNFS